MLKKTAVVVRVPCPVLSLSFMSQKECDEQYFFFIWRLTVKAVKLEHTLPIYLKLYKKTTVHIDLFFLLSLHIFLTSAKLTEKYQSHKNRSAS